MGFGKHLVRGLVAGAFLLAGSYSLSRTGFFVWPPHYDPLALPDLNEKPYWLTQTRLKLIDVDGENCSLALFRAGINFSPTPPKGAGTACEMDDAVSLAKLNSARIHTEDMRCNIAARLYMWERNVLQPEAKRWFGESVAEIGHFGSYSCRTIRGSSSMSEHSTGNAFDISGFKLKSGKTISVLKDWDDKTKAQFLTTVRDGLCDYFNLTLSPDYNADHKDHFHVDMGWVRGCH
jgi:hypothetical protein